MARNFYPPEGHDFVHTPDIRRLAAENQARLELKFLEDLSIFRADVFGKLAVHNALDGIGIGWAIFMPELDTDAEQTGSTVVMPRRDILLATYRIDPIGVNVIRLMSNEAFWNNGQFAFMTQDFTADTENDTQYLVDAIDPLTAPKVKSHATLFQPKDEALMFVNMETFTPVVDITGANVTSRIPDKAPEMTPFGRFSCLEDKIYALDMGRALFTEVMSLEPVACLER